MKYRDIRAVDERTLGFVVVGTVMLPFIALAGVGVASITASLVAAASIYLYFNGVVGWMAILTPEEDAEYMEETFEAEDEEDK